MDLDSLYKKIGAKNDGALVEITGDKLLSMTDDFVSAGAGIPMLELSLEDEAFIIVEFAESTRSLPLKIKAKDSTSVIEKFRKKVQHVE